MNEEKYLEQLSKLNMDYLELIKRPEIQAGLWKKRKKSIGYRAARLFEITYFLGVKVLYRYLFEKSTGYLNNENNGDFHCRKIVVYTCIFGTIDNILEPMYVNPDIDYYIITDQDVAKESIWKKISIDNYPELDKLSKQMKNRYCKIFPHKFFPEYDVSVYIDGNIQLITDIKPIVERMGHKSIGIFNHPKRDDLYVEAAAVIYLQNAKGSDVKKQMSVYKKEGFPDNFGLFENSLIVRRHNDVKIIEIMSLWWEQLNMYTKRDQLSFMYCLWKCKVNKQYVAALGKDIDLCPNIRRINHIDK